MEILGLLDTLESMILDGFKIPLTKNTMVNEEKLLSIIDKIRLVAQGGSDFAKRAITSEEGKGLTAERAEGASSAASGRPVEGGEENKAAEVIQQAYQLAKEIREGADRYADEILANLEATSTRILRTLKAGRDRLSKSKGES